MKFRRFPCESQKHAVPVARKENERVYFFNCANIKEYMMKRGKGFLLSLLGVMLIVLTGGVARAADEQTVHTWKCPTVLTSVMPDFKTLEEAFENIKKMSNGRLVIRAYPSGALMAGSAVYDGVKGGTVQMGLSYPNFQFGKNKVWGILNDEPFGFRKPESFLQWLYFGGGIEYANKLANADGIMWRPGSSTGVQTGAFCPDPIRSLEEAKGKSLRIGSGTHMEALKKVGINPTNLATEEIYGALDRKVVDMCEWTTPAIDWFLNFQEVAPHVIGPAWWQPTGVADFLINQKQFDKLPPDLQAILLTGLRDFSMYGSFKMQHLDAIYLKKFEEAGVKFYKWPEEDLKLLHSYTEETLQGLAAESPLFKEILESRRTYKKQYDDYEKWVKFSEF